MKLVPLSFELANLNVEPADAIIDGIGFGDRIIEGLARAADVSGLEVREVVIVLLGDEIGQVLVVEALGFSGDVALCDVAVEIDITVSEVVEMNDGLAARGFDLF